MIDPTLVRLGKHRPRHDVRTLRLGRYLTQKTALAVKPAVSWSQAVKSWPMMGNNTVGDCTCAAAGHLIQAWTANAGGASAMVTPSDEEILFAYSAITGYLPGHEETDSGAVELDVLNYWRQTGIAGRKIAAFAAVEPLSRTQVQLAIDLFGGIYAGVALPITAQNQAIWDVAPNWAIEAAPGSWGGHAIPVLDYDADGLLCITWGAVKRMTWRFWSTYVDESYALASPDWMNAQTGKDPEGLDLAALLSRVQQVAA